MKRKIQFGVAATVLFLIAVFISSRLMVEEASRTISDPVSAQEALECLVEQHEIVIDDVPGLWCAYTDTPTVTPLPPTATNTAVPSDTPTFTPLPTATNTAVPTPTATIAPSATPSPLPTDTPIPPSATPTVEVVISERGRVQIVNNSVVADNGQPLRGEHFVMSDNSGGSLFDGYLFDTLYDQALWNSIRDDYHLNTIRLLLSRPPQNWTPELGANCAPPTYRCFDFGYVMPNGKTMLQVLDDMVNRAAAMGMYIIIDYHPVGGHDAQDALDWWSVVAPRYADRTHVIYEAANEPVQWQAENYSTADVQFEADIYQHIRSLAPNTHIILWSFGNSTAGMKSRVDEAPSVNYVNASVAFHPYNYSPTGTQELLNNYPALTTEIGDNYPSHTQEAEALGISWVWLDGVFNFTPAQIVTWPADPNAIDLGAPTPTSTSTNTAVPPTATSTIVPTATVTSTAVPPTPTFTPTPTPTATAVSGGFNYFSTAVTFADQCQSAPELNSVWSGDWTIQTDIWLNQSQERHPIVSWQGQYVDARGFWFGVDSGNLYLELYHTTTTHTDLIGSSLPVGQWLTVTASFGGGVAALFVDGVQVAQVQNVAPLNQNGVDTQIGCYVWNSQYGWFLDGQLRNLSIQES